MKVPNKRADERIQALIPVTVRTKEGLILKGEVENISLGGALIRCRHHFSVGDTVNIELRFAGLKSVFGMIIEIDEIDDGEMVKAEETTEIRWENGGTTFGVRFNHLNKETERFLKRMIKFFNKLNADDFSD